MTKNNGCPYGQVTRQIVLDIKDSIKELKLSQQNFKVDIERKLDILFNHQSSKIPWWATSFIAVLMGACGFLLKTVLVK